MLEYSTGELLTRAAFMDHDDQGYDALRHDAVLKGLSPSENLQGLISGMYPLVCQCTIDTFTCMSFQRLLRPNKKKSCVPVTRPTLSIWPDPNLLNFFF